MIEQRAVLKLLSEGSVTETTPWILGEPTIEELLRDPLVHAVLRRDGLNPQDLLQAVSLGRGRLAPAALMEVARASDAA
ncbi:MAG: hypothetical protein GEU89_07870 [Kiloniellaceae bacterium]|nr:hypothetical protein [Kiloniellaceae bacterium]